MAPASDTGCCVTIVADTSVLVDNLRGRPAALEAFERLRETDESLVASVLTKVEILAGARPGEEGGIRALFDEIEWRDVDNRIAERAGELAAAFARTHRGVEIVDYVIAATVQLLGAELWTRNRKHFPMFPELAEPYEA